MWSSTDHDNNDDFFVAKQLNKSFGHVSVLSDVSFSVPRNSVVSFVGENGAGKSTLFNVLSGVLQPDSGSMKLDGVEFRPRSYGEALGHGVSRVFQEQSLILNIPVYENLILGLDRAFFKRGIQDRNGMINVANKIVTGAGIDVDVRRKSGSYDFSTRQAIEIARACLAKRLIDGCEHPLVLLDEPTSALDRRDEEAFFRLVDKVRQDGSLIFVSHRLGEVVELSDVIYVLKDGRIVAKILAKDANEKMLHELMVGRARVADHYHEGRQKVDCDGPVVLDVRNLSSADAYIDVSLKVRAGEILGIGGLLDSGKSALGKGIAGIDASESGKVGLMGNNPEKPDIRAFVNQGLGYVPAERLVEGIIPMHRLTWNFSLASADIFASRFGFWNKRLETQAARKHIDSLRIRSGTPGRILSDLSGGNQQKVVLARWLERDPKVLILDSPTRGVDAGAKEEIYHLLRELTDGGVGIVLITDELLELIGMSNRIIILKNGRVSAEFEAPADNKPTERELVVAMLPDGANSDDDVRASRYSDKSMERRN